MTRAHQQNLTSKNLERFYMLARDPQPDVITGILYVSPLPPPDYQKIVFRLIWRLAGQIMPRLLGEVFTLDTGLFVNGKPVDMPNFVLFTNNNKEAEFLGKGRLGPPDLVIEVLSPGTRRKDKARKKDFFLRLGVSEYWIIDPETKDSYGCIFENGRRIRPLRLNSKIYVQTLNRTFRF